MWSSRTWCCSARLLQQQLTFRLHQFNRLNSTTATHSNNARQIRRLSSVTIASQCNIQSNRRHFASRAAQGNSNSSAADSSPNCAVAAAAAAKRSSAASSTPSSINVHKPTKHQRDAQSKSDPSASASATTTSNQSDSSQSHLGEMSRFLGAKSRFTSRLQFQDPKSLTPMPCLRLLSPNGTLVSPHTYDSTLLSNTQLLALYRCMVRLSVLDSIFYDAQRQGRISFYMTSHGEEATHIGSAAALHITDPVFGQYREAGVLMWRGWSLAQFAHQCFSTRQDLGKGRQMPVHYGSRRLAFQTISSPLGTQLPQAVGAAYAMKQENSELQQQQQQTDSSATATPSDGNTTKVVPRVVMVYFGEGCASTADTHTAMNMSATLHCPVIFFCRNNGYAISTGTHEQYAGDGIASRGAAYGIRTIRVDGNDVLAVYAATRDARAYALAHNAPVLIEAMTYRGGHHSTSDDSTRYRAASEIEYWQEQEHPMTRLRLHIESKQLWDSEQETALRKKTRKSVLAALTQAEQTRKPPVNQLFEDVYDELTPQLREQKAELEAHLALHGDKYGLAEFCAEEDYEQPDDEPQN